MPLRIFEERYKHMLRDVPKRATHVCTIVCEQEGKWHVRMRSPGSGTSLWHGHGWIRSVYPKKMMATLFRSASGTSEGEDPGIVREEALPYSTELTGLGNPCGVPRKT